MFKAGIGAGVAGLAAQTLAALRSLMPNVTSEAPVTVRLGPIDEIAEGLRFYPEHRLFLLKGMGKLHAISAVCSHLGCTVRAEALDGGEQAVVGGVALQLTHRFLCPCHGSRYRGDGMNLSGPAPSALPWYELSISPEDGQLLVDLGLQVKPGTQLTIG